VTIGLGIAGLGVQGLLLAFFLGRMKAHQEGQTALVAAFQNFTEKAISQLATRMEKVDAFTAESQADRATLTARVKGIEQNTDGLPLLREQFARHVARSEAHQERLEADLARANTGIESLQRQVAQLAIHGPGRLVEMASPK
jgi:chromosome segregation ATPase